jgi:cell division protein FtsN
LRQSGFSRKLKRNIPGNPMKKPALRFDAKETVVLFSLFIFVSLLMFTVGILVGKGLTQAKYENKLPELEPAGQTLVKANEPHSGSSVSLGTPTHHDTAEHAAATPEAATGHAKAEKTEPNHTEAAEADHGHETPVAAKAETVPETPTEAIKLVPLKPTQAEASGVNLSDPKNVTAELMKNPKIRSLVESDPNEERRTPSSAPSSAAQASSEKGSFTVQVGSYPNETAAKERVESLKKMGFPQAFFSAKELGSASGTWYRVWLGEYPDYQTAKKTGDQLQARGEVKNYIVRKNN